MTDSTKQSGFLLIDKRECMTSFDVLRDLKKRGFKKLGHAGTLDPFATGLLIVLLGNATRLMEYVLLLPKTYEAELVLGATSDTDDGTGKITPLTKEGRTSESEVGRVLQGFRGPISQIPPDYAALKINGQRMYNLARKGESVTAKPREVMIYQLELVEYSYPKVVIRVQCGSGTYIRALGRDIGQALGTGAYVQKLRRTESGPWSASQADPALIRPLEELVAHLPSVILADDVAQSMRQGKAVVWASELPGTTPLALLDMHKKLLGIGAYETTTSLLKAHKILPLSSV